MNYFIAGVAIVLIIGVGILAQQVADVFRDHPRLMFAVTALLAALVTLATYFLGLWDRPVR